MSRRLRGRFNANPSMPTWFSRRHGDLSKTNIAMDVEKRQEQNKNICGGPGAGVFAFSVKGEIATPVRQAPPERRRDEVCHPRTVF